ncbi:MAG TPA: YihY/virulence factor BrkB family protein [Marmoricola sp.]|nr:YihY/virulence factor BrkB family protein [Marmoricola sp.]
MTTSEATSIGGPAEESSTQQLPSQRPQPETRPLGNPETSATAPVVRRSAGYVLRKTVREFRDDHCTDLAATLTYYAVLSLFPAALAVLSVLGVVGDGRKAVGAVVDVLQPLLPTQTLDAVREALLAMAGTQGGGVLLVAGILGTVWSASAWVNAFGRAMNRVYEVEEGRPAWKLRPAMLLVTAAALVLCAVALLIVVFSGPVADSVGRQLGLGSTVVTVWEVAKWPLLAVVVVGNVALLYWATPNVRQPRFRILSAGAFVAILVWLATSAGFAVYVANFSSWNATYGSLGGVIVALLWLWLTNNALLFGGELDAELERARELAAGTPAEEVLQLPLRDRRGVEKARARRSRDVEAGREVRESAGSGDPDDRPFRRR